VFLGSVWPQRPRARAHAPHRQLLWLDHGAQRELLRLHELRKYERVQLVSKEEGSECVRGNPGIFRSKLRCLK
jgi:hypothetical protein